MYINAIKCLTRLCSIILLIQIIIIVDTNNLITPSPNRQICTEIQSMLLYGKYQTHQTLSNITYVSRVYAQNLLAYSPLNDLFVFLEPKYQLHVYNAQTIQLIVNIPITNIVYAASALSLTNPNQYDLFFIYETRLESNLVSIRLCQMDFDISTLSFHDKKCLNKLIIRCDTPDIRIHGFTIKQNHSQTDKSLIFVSTDIGLVYTVFDVKSGVLIREPIILNDTLNEGSIVTTSSGVIYYANKQENTIHEIHVTKDFRIRYGKIIKSNAIKLPFGLITDECDHLYIATKSMILVMFVQTYRTIRSIFSKASELPITVERINATTYIYPTVRKSGKIPSTWAFNFLYFSHAEKTTVTTRPPVINITDDSITTTTPIPLLQSESFTSIPANHLEITTHTSTDQTVPGSISTEDLTSSSSSDSNVITRHMTSTMSSLETLTSTIWSPIYSTSFALLNTILTDSYTTWITPSITDLADNDTQQTSELKSTFPPSLSTKDSTSYDVISTTTDLDTTTSLMDNIIESTISLETTSPTDQFQSTTIRSVDTNAKDDAYMTSTTATDSPINSSQTSTLFMSITDSGNKGIEDESVQINLSSTLHSLLLFDVSSTVSIPSHSSQSSLSSHHPSPSLLYPLLSSKHFLVTTSTPFSTLLSSSISTLDTTEQSSITTLLDESSSLATTTYPDETSTVTLSTMILTSTLSDSTTTVQTEGSSFVTTSYLEETSMFTSTISTEPITTTDYVTSSTLVVTSTSLDSTMTTIQTEKPTTLLIETPVITSSTLFETESVSSTMLLTKYVFTTSQSTPLITLTQPRFSRPVKRKPIESTTIFTTFSTITTTDSYRTRQQHITSFESQSSISPTSTTIIETTSAYNQIQTSTSMLLLHSKVRSFHQQQMIVLKPTLDTNSTNTLLSNELLKTLFTNKSNSSSEKSIFINLSDLPPASWNLSLNTNDSINLDIALPPASAANRTTNLTFTNVEANRFATNIVGVPINLQVDQVQTKQFSLAMNLTNNQSNHQSLSDVVIGHIKSEQFELNITKTDNMNVHVHQVDSETAELFFDSKFCTNESNLQINLNLSKNGTIRYGNRKPLHIGPVFTRVHMLKQSCDLDQPFTLFFDICQGQNPCLNGGKCQSKIPNYDDPSYSSQQSSQIDYQCICPSQASGEHCQNLQYPFGYCINGGSLMTIVNSLTNQTIEQCLCPEGFQGEHCENNIDDCINIDCSNHGRCQDGINTYTCSCFDGFYGNECEQTTVETVLLQVASKSFATVAILLISAIAGLVVASDIHTFLTRKNKNHRIN